MIYLEENNIWHLFSVCLWGGVSDPPYCVQSVICCAPFLSLSLSLVRSLSLCAFLLVLQHNKVWHYFEDRSELQGDLSFCMPSSQGSTTVFRPPRLSPGRRVRDWLRQERCPQSSWTRVMGWWRSCCLCVTQLERDSRLPGITIWLLFWGDMFGDPNVTGKAGLV